MPRTTLGEHNGHYVLDDAGHAVPCPDLDEWANWFESADRRLAVDMVGDIRISTVFLTIDHRFSGKGPPILWETMIFGGPDELDEYQRRYTSRADALVGHETAVAASQRGHEVL